MMMDLFKPSTLSLCIVSSKSQTTKPENLVVSTKWRTSDLLLLDSDETYHNDNYVWTVKVITMFHQNPKRLQELMYQTNQTS